MSIHRSPSTLAYLYLTVGLAACSASDPGTDLPSATGGAVSPGSGGASLGGAGQSKSPQGGQIGSGANASVGGSSGGAGSGSRGGSTSAGGSSINSGSGSVGGAAVGGKANGGAATGGANVGGTIAGGGKATGGVATGGTTAGGKANGGAATGGANVGGTAAGGKAAGGAAVGGSAAGGKAAGGTSSGGAATGGAATGGAATGGAATGGAATGGNGATCSGSGEVTWPVYSPTIAYDYVDEYGTIAAPSKASTDVTGVAGRYSDKWWTFAYGANKNSLVTAAAWVPMVARFNTDFAYITDTMRWPRDSRARSGNYSAIYLYGSGLSTDTASNTALGGWQSGAAGGPMVLASYYPVYSYDPACPYNDKVNQQGAMIHEGIHCILASMPGCKKACWFQEGGNTWLQATMEAKRSGQSPTSMGFLSAGAAIAPFMPIESYSGWLQDDSFGGPCAERVNMTNASGAQVCTWRNLLGGTQYGETFPHAMEVILGEKSIAWVWRYAQASGRVLQDLAEVTGGIGVTQTKRLIQEYRARQAFGDFGIWKAAYKKLLNDNWKATIKAEWTPSWMDPPPWTASCYAATTQSGNTLTPEARTLPGWSGANQIPLTLSAGATCANITFTPSGANMTCQLVYQDTSGGVHYGAPVASGTCSVPVSNVKNNVVVAVISNQTYIYDGGTTKYGYTLGVGDGIAGKADIYTQWYK